MHRPPSFRGPGSPWAVTLTELDDAIAAKRWEGALEGALIAWRTARHPLVAALVEALAGRVAATPIFARGDKDAVPHAKWLARASEPAPPM